MLKQFSALTAVALLALIGSSYGHATRVLKCPCAFSVSREVRNNANHESFDVIVSAVTSTNKTPLRFNKKHFERHSSRNMLVSDAVRTQSGRHIFRKMAIADKGLYHVQIRHHSSRAIEENPGYDLELHTVSRQVVCPVILQPDPPLVDSVARQSSTDKLPEMARVENNPRIVGGLGISPTLLPYLVAVQILHTGSLCTGTLLSAKWIMTAAHCGVAPGSRVLPSTRSNLFGPFAARVTRVFSHPLYDIVPGNARNFYDIAVAELDTDVTTCTVCDPAPEFMPVNFNSRLPRPGTFTRTAGFGVASEDGSVPEPEPGLLRQVDVPAVNISTCRDIYITISEENEQVCAGYLRDGECDACFGDSGGPLVQYAGTTPVLMGITSFGAGCARPGFPGVYTNPAGHRDFLLDTPAVFTRNRQRITQVRRRCRRGEYLPFIKGSTSNCTPCPANSISPGGPVRLCEECPGNMLRDTRRGDRCSCRALAGFGAVSGEENCVECRAGFSSAIGRPRCTRCPVDTYQPDPGMADCLPCPGASRGSTTCP